MLSMWIKDRINANHMEHIEGKGLKEIEALCIEDFIPTLQEKEYLFASHVHYFSYVLVQRFPEMFKSLNSSIKMNKAHQFEEEMSCKSEEFSGDLFTKSESNMDDLISMMEELQLKYVHTHKSKEGTVSCHEKKVLSGDNKTEKNSNHGILR